MRITILNGNPEAENPDIEEYLEQLVKELDGKDHQTQQFNLREMQINYCIGCFGCWVKTPGECVFKDDMPQIYRAVVNSDLLLLVSPVKMGFVSALSKKTLDRMIPLIHPYIVIDKGECHHLKRYKKYPKLGLILQENAQTDAQDLEITQQIFRRLSINFKSSLGISRLTSEPIEEVVHEINSL